MKYRNIIAVVIVMLAVFAVSAAAQTKGKQRSQSVRIKITQMGYEPGSITLKRGIPAQLTFLRLTDNTCATEVVFPDYGINRPLPLNKAVTVRLTPRKAGEFAFTCGMNMHRGKMIVR